MENSVLLPSPRSQSLREEWIGTICLEIGLMPIKGQREDSRSFKDSILSISLESDAILTISVSCSIDRGLSEAIKTLRRGDRVKRKLVGDLENEFLDEK